VSEQSEVNATVTVRVTLDLTYPQPFGSDWKLCDVQKRAASDARETAQRMAAEVCSASARVVSVDPNVTIRLAVKP
jgi:hypothetical protein